MITFGLVLGTFIATLVFADKIKSAAKTAIDPVVAKVKAYLAKIVPFGF